MRQFRFVQYEYNPVSGKSLNFGVKNFDHLLDTAGDHIFAAEIIRHDSDEYTEAQHDAYVKRTGHEPLWHVGDHEPEHWQGGLITDDTMNPYNIADALGIPDFMATKLVKPIYRRQGQTDEEAWIEYSQYLTHSNQGEKHTYDVSEVIATFDYPAEIWGQYEAEL